VAAAQDDVAAQVGDNGDDMVITAFPALAPHLRSVAYPDNFKHNIQKYDGHSDPNIWLSTYYVVVKAAGGNFDHMTTYFMLVMSDAPSLWLNNLPAGSITSWADLSQAFTSNFPATYNRPGNAFNLGRATMKAGERLRDYTNQFFENRKPVSAFGTNRSSTARRKVSGTARSLRRSTSLAPLMDVVNKLIDTDEALVNQFDRDGKQDTGSSGAARDSSSKFRKRP
jgi:hypothetical protein